MNFIYLTISGCFVIYMFFMYCLFVIDVQTASSCSLNLKEISKLECQHFLQSWLSFIVKWSIKLGILFFFTDLSVLLAWLKTNEISMQSFDKPSNVKSFLLFSSIVFHLAFFGKFFVIFCKFPRVQLTY